MLLSSAGMMVIHHFVLRCSEQSVKRSPCLLQQPSLDATDFAICIDGSRTVLGRSGVGRSWLQQ